MAQTANGTVLITKETSYSSIYTYYKLVLDNLTRKGTNISVTLHVYLTLGSKSGAGSNWNRTLYVYDSGGNLLASNAIKSGSVSWNENSSYNYTISFNITTSSGAAWSQSGFYIRILKSPSTASGDGGSCVWNGTTNKSGGSTGNTFTLSANASNLVHIYVNGGWKDATPYVYVNGWKEATAYIWNGSWKECN